MSKMIHTAIITHRHGTNSEVARTEARIYDKVAAYCIQYWSELPDAPHAKDDPTLPPKGWSNQKIVSYYFENHGSEGVEFGVAELEDE